MLFCSKKSERGAVMVESALALPFLFMVVLGLWGIGRLYMQVTWLTTTSYESIMAGSEAIESIGLGEMQRIKTMFEGVLNNSMNPVAMSRTYFSENDGNGDAVPLVRVGLDGNMLATQGWSSLGVSVEFIGAHTGKDQGLPENPTFSVVKGPYTCEGVRCGGSTGVTCPGAPC